MRDETHGAQLRTYLTGINSSRRPCGKMPYSFGPSDLSARMANITLSRTMASAP